MLCINVRTCLSTHPPPVCRGWSGGLVFLPSLPSQIFFILQNDWIFGRSFRVVWSSTVGGTFAGKCIFLQIKFRHDIAGLFLIHIRSRNPGYLCISVCSIQSTLDHTRPQFTKLLVRLNILPEWGEGDSARHIARCSALRHWGGNQIFVIWRIVMVTLSSMFLPFFSCSKAFLS